MLASPACLAAVCQIVYVGLTFKTTVYAYICPDCCVMALTPGQQYIHFFPDCCVIAFTPGQQYMHFFLTVALWRLRQANSIYIFFPDCCVMAFTPGQQYMHIFS